MNKTKLVPPELHNIRIDTFLASAWSTSRSQGKKWIEQKNVSSNLTGNIQKSGYLIRADEQITVTLPEVHTPEVRKVAGSPCILFENTDFCVVSKPAGIPVHPDDTYTEDTLVQRVLSHCPLSSVGLPSRPGVVHRLDKDTSGVILFAKNDETHHYLCTLFSERKIKKKYIALIHGTSIPDTGTINSPITRNPKDRKKMIVSTSKNARHALTHFTVQERYHSHTLLDIEIETGRTHQIRVHLSAIGFPVVGDIIYGDKKRDSIWEKKHGSPPLFLHAHSIAFIPPHETMERAFLCDLPEKRMNILERLRG